MVELMSARAGATQVTRQRRRRGAEVVGAAVGGRWVKRSGERKPYAERSMTLGGLRGAMAKELVAASKSSVGEEIGRQRAARLRSCCAKVMVMECGDCRYRVPGSGVVEKRYRCELRCCPMCAKGHGIQLRQWMERAVELVPRVAGWSWQYLVVTKSHDPTTRKTVKVLERDASELLGAMAKWGRRVRSRWAGRAGALVMAECGPRGNVHANVVFYGPAQDAAELSTELKKLGMGYAHVTRLEREGGEASSDGEAWGSEELESVKAACGNVVQYASKGVAVTRTATVMSESALAGHERLTTLDPRLAARWELAIFGRNTVMAYGCLNARAASSPLNGKLAGRKRDGGVDLRDAGQDPGGSELGSGRDVGGGARVEAESDAPDGAPTALAVWLRAGGGGTARWDGDDETEACSEVACPNCGRRNMHWTQVSTSEWLAACHAQSQKAMLHGSWRFDVGRVRSGRERRLAQSSYRGKTKRPKKAAKSEVVPW